MKILFLLAGILSTAASFTLHESVVFNYDFLEEGVNYCNQPCSAYSGLITSKSPAGSVHTMCLPNDKYCTEITKWGVTASDITTILDAHNKLRNDVASGSKSPQPAAADMNKLSWNSELAVVAQAWANTCFVDGSHDCNECRKITSRTVGVGQNAYQAWKSSDAADWNGIVDYWFKEIADMPTEKVDAYTKGGVNNKAIGHYTQVVWAETTEVGCAYAAKPCKLMYKGVEYDLMCQYALCNYAIGGNLKNAKVYEKTTTPGSSCSSKDSTYTSLCAVDSNLYDPCPSLLEE